MKTRSRLVIGSILILSGALSLIGNLNILNENLVLPIMGAAFLVLYFVLGARKRYGNIGFLIPGIILPALQILKFADDNNVSERAEVAIVFGVLSGSFLLIYLLHSLWFKDAPRGKRNWPLYVSFLMVVLGALVYAVEYYDWGFGVVLLDNMWPVVLVIIGARMLYKALKGKKEDLGA